MGVWSSGDPVPHPGHRIASDHHDDDTEAQMTGSNEFVSGPWRYERLTCDHWVPVNAADEFSGLLPDFLRRYAGTHGISPSAFAAVCSD